MGSAPSSSRNRNAGGSSSLYPGNRSSQRFQRRHTRSGGGGSINNPPRGRVGTSSAPPVPASTGGLSASAAPRPNTSLPPSSAAGASGPAVVGGPASSPSGARALNRPGAYSITRDSNGPEQTFRVQIPPQVRPGQEFEVIAGPRRVRVRCPPESRGGHYLQITVPPDQVVVPVLQGMAVLTSATPGAEGGGAVPMRAEVAAANEVAAAQQLDRSRSSQELLSDGRQQPQPQPATYMVTVPEGIRPGMQFGVDVNDQRMMVTCPPDVQSGMNLRIVPPSPSPSLPSAPGTSLDRPPESRDLAPQPPTQPPLMQMFEVVVPPGVRPNQPFSLLANGQRVLVTCPPHVRPGVKIRFQLPATTSKDTGGDKPTAVSLSYDSIKDGWTRTIRVTDMKFQWVRMNENGDVEDPANASRFDARQSAYVRDLAILDGNDKRMRTGSLALVNAGEYSVESRVLRDDGTEVVRYAELAAAANDRKTFDEKLEWFREVCDSRLRADWSEGHMRIHVRRAHLLDDSIIAVMSLGRADMRKTWRFEFMGEAAIDAGGLSREWFQLVSSQMFDPDMGLWMSNSSNQQQMRINPASEMACPEDHLIYFRFLGRVMGKALFDGQLVAGHMVRHLYKHLLGWPITFDDLELADEERYRNLKKFAEMGSGISDVGIDFTFTENALGMNKEVELIEGGSDLDVSEDNLPEYLEANLKYLLMDRVRPQTTELLLGFYDVIPEPLLLVFDFQELELFMCGMPNIDVDDWVENTTYAGAYERSGPRDQTVQWFWEVVRDEFDQETRARLLQFVTGTSGVPSRGFSVLQGNDGNIRKFCINGISKDISFYPRSHTCFNRIDLPIYTSKEELLEKLKVAVTTSATGFDIE